MIKSIRLSLGMNQREFAEALDMSTTMINTYENRKRKLSLTCARLIQDFAAKNSINVSLDDLLSNKKNEKDDIYDMIIEYARALGVQISIDTLRKNSASV